MSESSQFDKTPHPPKEMANDRDDEAIQSQSPVDLDEGTTVSPALLPPRPDSPSVLQALAKQLPNTPHVELHSSGQSEETLFKVSASHVSQPKPESAERYQLDRELARGGMGVVYKGKDSDLGREVAVKVILETHRGRTEILERFIEEAQIGGQLQHPGIVPVYELGRFTDDRPYFAMKLVKGRTLSELLKESAANTEKPTGGGRRVTPNLPRFLSIFEQICQTMAYAHARGVIHRDLKPSNIMLGSFGEVQVMDWGLAKVLGKQGSEVRGQESGAKPTDGGPWVRRETPQTRAGSVLGTPAYMAPEQARGEIDNLDERCDVFGLGAILCQILTGHPPFSGQSVEEELRQARQGDVADAFRRLNQCGADEELILVAKRCLEPDPGKRFRRAGETAAAVTAYLQSVQERLRKTESERIAAQAKAVEERKRRRITMALAAVSVLMIIGAGAVGWRYQQQRAEAAQQLARIEQGVRNAIEQAGADLQQLHAILQNQGGVFRLLNDPSRWEGYINTAKAALRRADELQAGSTEPIAADLLASLQKLREQLKSDERDRSLAGDFEQARMAKAIVTKNDLDYARTAKRYADVFAKYDMALNPGNENELAERINKSPIKEQFVAALDDWMVSAIEAQAIGKGKKELWRRILSVTRKIDTGEWQDQIRNPDIWEKPKAVDALTRRLPREKVSPHLLFLTGMLREYLDLEAETWTRQAQELYPSDFWLNVYTSYLLLKKKPEESIGFARAALAIRPQSGDVVYNLIGVANYYKKDTRRAIAALQKAIQLNPGFAEAHASLGMSFRDWGDLKRAVAELREAVRLDPKNATALNNLGLALYEDGQPGEAILFLNRSLELEGIDAITWTNLGIALYQVGKVHESIAALERAVKLNGKYGDGRYTLASILQSTGRFSAAVAVSEKALKELPKDAEAVEAIREILKESQRLLGLEKKLGAVVKNTKAPAGELYDLADLCRNYKKDHALAVALYRRAFAAQPFFADNLEAGWRYGAAQSAVRAAAADAIKAATFRKQAAEWLRADLALLQKRFADEPLPLDVVQIDDILADMLSEPAFNKLRGDESLKTLPDAERKLWQSLWDEMQKLKKQTSSRFTVKVRRDILTGGDTERSYDVVVPAGTTCIASQSSSYFKPFLLVREKQTMSLVETEELGVDDWNPQFSFTSEVGGAYRIVASSRGRRGRGAFTLRVYLFPKSGE